MSYIASLNKKHLDSASEALRSIAHPLRLSILRFIDEKKVINVNKIYNSLKLEQSITSQHLRIMRSANLVEAKREGKFIHYSVNYDRIKELNDTILEFNSKFAVMFTESEEKMLGK